MSVDQRTIEGTICAPATIGGPSTICGEFKVLLTRGGAVTPRQTQSQALAITTICAPTTISGPRTICGETVVRAGAGYINPRELRG